MWTNIGECFGLRVLREVVITKNGVNIFFIVAKHLPSVDSQACSEAYLRVVRPT